MNHDETRLPKWAQRRLESERHARRLLAGELRRLEEASAVLSNREWFTLRGPERDEVVPRKLWYFAENQPVLLATLGERDLVLVGRDKKYGSVAGDAVAQAEGATDAG